MDMRETEFPGVVVFAPRVFEDDRGYFFETWSQERYAAAGIMEPFVQDNMSHSRRGTLRGLHLQHPFGQGKLVSVLAGEVFDVAVDVRADSPTFGHWTSQVLSESNHLQMYIPAGFAHGFCVTSETAVFVYKCTEKYHPESEMGVVYDDPDLAIPWPIEAASVSQKDRALPRLRDIDRARLPRMETSA